MQKGELITLWWHIAPLIILNSVFLISMFFFWLIFWDGKDHPELVGRTNTKILTVHLKNWWYWVTTPLLDILLALRATPNAVTTLGLLLSIAAGFAFSQGYLGTAGWLMIFGGYCDSLDGRVARVRRMESRAGNYYDAMLDRIGEVAILIGLMFWYWGTLMLFVTALALAGSLLVSYAKARGELMGIQCKEGLMQRPERVVYLGVGSILSPIIVLLLKPHLNLPIDIITSLAIAFTALMTWITTFQRIRFFMKSLA